MKEYKITNFYDIVSALRKYPDWLDEVRELILTEDLINLPQRFNEFVKRFEDFVQKEFRPLVKRVDKMEKRLDRVESDVKVLKKDVKELKKDVRVLKQDVAGLKQDVAGLKKDVAGLKKDVKVLKQDVGKLKGESLERRVRDRSASYFGRVLKRIRLIDNNKLADMLEDAVDQGIISEDEKMQVLRADGVLKGKRKEDGEEVWIVFEVSYVIDKHDIERARKRAAIFQKVVDKDVLPAVVGEEYVISKEQIEKQGIVAIRYSF
ncbi:MAG: hypothetical protein DRQ10_02020 [Candidatus Hydrothermota bacterium]|nr:MAG: hypothetical protein DRQ10_02020 [Candidatus Hydrothermae bacterium]